MERHKYRLIIPFLAPALITYVVFVMYPYLSSMYTSFTFWRGLAAPPKWVGLYNFEKMLADGNFWNALTHNLKFLIILPTVTLVLALFFAAAVTRIRTGPGNNFYRITYYFPQVMSAVAISVLWSFIYHPSIGILNSFLNGIGLSALARPWLGDGSVALGAIAAVSIWQAVGFYMVLFIAGMQSIPDTFYEAAKIDGAGDWRCFFSITLPLLWDTIQTSLVYISIAAIDMFVFVQVMTFGGPNRATDVLAVYLYEVGFKNGEFGYATAIAVAMFVLTLCLSVFTLRVTRREAVEF